MFLKHGLTSAPEVPYGWISTVHNYEKSNPPLLKATDFKPLLRKTCVCYCLPKLKQQILLRQPLQLKTY